MNDQTEITSKPKRAPDSRLFGLSVRAIIALFVVLTVCFMSVLLIEVKEPLYTLAGLVVGFYFGQNQKPATP